jgi:hypothetical protein
MVTSAHLSGHGVPQAARFVIEGGRNMLKRTIKTYSRTLILLLAVACSTAYADRGSIPFRPGVRVFEPEQRAMIAWNGKEEILLLSTDLRASEATEVLEVLPLPSEPKVKKGDIEVFRRATKLINEKLRRRPKLSRAGVRTKGPRGGPAGEVTFHEKIGAHDVSVTHVLNEDGFIEWVENYLRSVGVANPTVPAPMKEVVAEYLKEKFSWFVFDVVSLEEETRTNDAIQYRFATESLFYPLKITRTEEGQTSIELLVLTPRLLSSFPGIPTERVRLLHEPVAITSLELRSLSEEMDRLLGSRDTVKLRIWQITGKLSSFHQDLVAR